MIRAEEILMGRDRDHPITFDLSMNLARLLAAVNYVRGRYGRSLTVSSGYRPEAINKAAGGAKMSAHMTLEAVDFADSLGDFRAWCLSNQHELEKAGLYMESPDHTPTWVHLQTRAPKSGNRIFIP